MPTNYLDKFRSGLKAIQSRQILALISREKESGQIKTVEEFKNRLNELTNKLQSTTIVPTLQLYLSEYGDYIDSDTFNFMLDRIEDDLVTSFNEANTIDEVIDAHETIINDVVIKNLDIAINELDGNISALEFINQTNLGLNYAVSNSFQVTQNNTGSDNQRIIFIDPKTNIQASASNAATIDLIGEKLVSSIVLDQNVEISSVRQVFDEDTIQSELDVQIPNSNINNIIDQTIGKFWAHSILLSKTKGESGVKTKLELDFGSIKTINYLQLEPIFLYTAELFSIYYLDQNNQFQSLLEDPIQISTINKFFFESISTSKLLITFRNKNFTEVQFEQKPDDPIVYIERNTEVSVVPIEQDLSDFISSPNVRSTLGLDINTLNKVKYYEYLFGLDNIKTGLSSFKETSFFISKSEKVFNPNVFGIKTVEKRPFSTNNLNTDIEYTLDTQPTSFTNNFKTSIEYYLVKRDFDITGNILSSNVIPVLPLNHSVVRHERLILSTTDSSTIGINNIGYLQFYTKQSIEDIKVYKNGQLLVHTNGTTINPTTVDGWLKSNDFSIDLPGQDSAMKYAIKIQAPNSSDIYTVSYTPALSASNIVSIDENLNNDNLIDVSGKLNTIINNNNLLVFQNASVINYSLMNLVIVLRRNTSNEDLTPVVEEYILSSGSISSDIIGGTYL